MQSGREYIYVQLISMVWGNAHATAARGDAGVLEDTARHRPRLQASMIHVKRASLADIDHGGTR